MLLPILSPVAPDASALVVLLFLVSFGLDLFWESLIFLFIGERGILLFLPL